MLKIRRPLGSLIFNMGIAIPGKTVFLIETAPWCLVCVPNIIFQGVLLLLSLHDSGQFLTYCDAKQWKEELNMSYSEDHCWSAGTWWLHTWRAPSQYKGCFPGMGISIIKIRWAWDLLIFIMAIPIVVRQLYIDGLVRERRTSALAMELSLSCTYPSMLRWALGVLWFKCEHVTEFNPIPFHCQRESLVYLTHWGRATHICVGKLTTIGSDNGLSPGRRQAIIRTIAGILSIGPLGTNISEILIGIQAFSFKKMHLKMASAKWRPSCLGLNVLNVPNMEVAGNSSFSLIALIPVW